MLDFNDAEPQSHLRLAYDMAWEARTERLRQALSGRARDLIDHVFPSARVHGAEARIGSTDGEPGESLSIDLTSGVWFDHATGEGGDLIDLWKATQKATFPEAIDDLERWAGLASAPAFTSRVHKVAEKRKEEAKKHAGVDTGLGPPVASWYYKSADDTLIGIVRRYDLAGQFDDAGKPKKTFRPFTASGEPRMPDPRPLYRLPQIATASTVVLVEGEKCADALETVGVEATTVMGGANTHLEKTDFTPLAGKTVLLWPDNDGLGKTEKVSFVGQRYMERLKIHLEALGCRVGIVEIPPNKPAKWDAADAVKGGDDVTAILAAAMPDTTAASMVRFRILTIDELANVKPPEWRIHGIFPTHGSSTVYGAFESFKTWVGIDMLLSLAAGVDWQGRASKPCSVLYIAGEGQHGLAHRVVGWCEVKNAGVRPARFRALPEAVAIPASGDIDDLLRAIDDLPEAPGVIALDTITRMSGGGSLNDEKDVQAYVRGMDRLRTATGAHIMNIGHAGKDKEKGLMGSVVLPGAMETIICVERKGDNLTLINNNPKGKQKDGPNFEDIHLVTRKVSFVRDGKTDTTLILVPVEPAENDETKPARRLGPLQQKIMTALEQAARNGQSLGFTSLKIMTGSDDGTLGRTLRNLVEREVISVSEEEGKQQWKFL